MANKRQRMKIGLIVKWYILSFWELEDKHEMKSDAKQDENMKNLMRADDAID